MNPSLEALTLESFGRLSARPGLALIDFGAAWCPPCRVYSPVFAATAARFPEVAFATVDVDAQPTLADLFDVRSLPTTIALRDGEYVGRLVGAVGAPTLERLVTELVDRGSFNLAEARRAVP
ncbi:MAG: thioredoxin family protein [Myxococcota bacterium]